MIEVINRYLPLKVFLYYSVFVFSTLFLGPVKYININYISIGLYVLGVILFFSFGFVNGVKGVITLNSSVDKLFIKNIVNMFIVVGVLISIFSWVEVIEKIAKYGLVDFGNAYVNYYDGYVRGASSIDFFYIYNIFESSVYLLCVLFIFSFYTKLSQLYKILSIFVLFTSLMAALILSGKQKSVGDFFIFFSYAYILHTAVNARKFPVRKIIYLVVAVFIVFSYLLHLRYSAIGLDEFNIVDKLHPLTYWEKDTLLSYILPLDIAFPVGMFLMYFSNGLYGLSISLELEFTWSYFLGSSYSVSRLFEKILGAPDFFVSKTYPSLAAEHGWGFDKWHSSFSWLASDFTFPGVLILISAVGFLYGRMWRRILNGENPIARVIFIYMSLGIIFMYANNQIFHPITGVICTFILLVMYIKAQKYNDNKR